MTVKEQMIENGENLSWCKPYVGDRVSIVMCEGKVASLMIDDSEVDVTMENLVRAAKIVNPNYDDYDGWSAEHILLEGNLDEVGCSECPWFNICDAMDGEVEEQKTL